MQFSLWNFKEWFGQKGIDLSYQITGNAPSISMLSLSPDLSEKDSALILPGDELEDCSGFNSVMIQGNNRILFPIASSIEIANQGNAMIQHFSEWERKLFDGVMDDWPVSRLFQTIQEEFPFPFALILPGGSVHHRSKDWNISLKEANRQTVLQAALKSPENAPVCRTFRFDLSRSYLVGTVMNGNKPVAVLTAYEDTFRFQPGHITLFYFIIEMIQTYLRFHTELTPTTHPLAGWFQHAIEMKDQESLTLPTELNDLAWSEDDYYQIAAVGLHGDQPASTLSDLYYRFSSVSICCAIRENILLILLHYGNIYPKYNRFELTKNISNHGISSGLSLPFRGLLQFRTYQNQAIRVLSQAQSIGAHLIRIEDHLIDHLKEACQEIPEVHTLIHPDILALEREDSLCNEHLIETLYTYYIQGQSSAKASQTLFIHRNTLRNRLDHIQKILSIDLEKAEARRQYMISLLLCSE